MSDLSIRSSSTSQLYATQSATKTEKADVGTIGGHSVTLGEGNRNVSRAGEMLKAAGSFFKSIGTGIADAFTGLKDKIKTAYTDYQTARADRAEAKRMESFGPVRDSLLASLPSGVAINDQGVISGTHTALSFPDDPALGGQRGQTLEDVLENSGRSQLAPAPDPKTGQVPPMAVISGIPVTSQAVKDLYRLNLTIDNGANNVYRSSADATTDGARNTSVVNQMRAFTGSDAATTVLTSVINQQFSRLFTDSWSKDDGSRSVCQIDQGKQGPVKYTDPTGATGQVTPGGIGTAPITLSKTANNDFKVSINWEMYYTDIGRGFDKSEMPGMDGSAIKAQGHVEFVIDRQSAAAGQLDLQLTQPTTISFEGKMRT